jgi:ankyrin repeat protein
MTLQNVNDRLHKASSNIPQSSHSSSDAKAETALEFIVFCIRDRYSTEIKRILAFTERLESGRAESVLRRALDAIDQFLAIVQTPVPSKITDYKAILKSKAKILDRLVSFYKGTGDFPEAERLLAKLSTLSSKFNMSNDPRICLRLAESLTRTSRRMHNVLIDLGIPEKYKNSLHFPDSGPFPPIHRALLGDNESVARHLCESTKEIHEQVDILGRQPVHIIAESSNLGFLDLIHSKNRNDLQASDIGRRTPLCIAAYIGDLPFFENLFHAGANVESRDEEGRSILYVACGAGHLSIVQFLLDRKISPNDGSFADCSPLHAAASAGHLEICRALLEAGAWTDWYMHKPPIQAAKENDHFDVVSLIGEFAGRSENSWSLGMDSPALDESSTFPSTSQPRTAVRHADHVHSPPPTLVTPAGNTRHPPAVSVDEALDASYEIVDCAL